MLAQWLLNVFEPNVPQLLATKIRTLINVFIVFSISNV